MFLVESLTLWLPTAVWNHIVLMEEMKKEHALVQETGLGMKHNV